MIRQSEVISHWHRRIGRTSGELAKTFTDDSERFRVPVLVTENREEIKVAMRRR